MNLGILACLAQQTRQSTAFCPGRIEPENHELGKMPPAPRDLSQRSPKGVGAKMGCEWNRYIRIRDSGCTWTTLVLEANVVCGSVGLNDGRSFGE